MNKNIKRIVCILKGHEYKNGVCIWCRKYEEVFETCVSCGDVENKESMYDIPAGYHCEHCAERLGIYKPIKRT